MSVRRPAMVAVVSAVLAVLLWWLARDVVAIQAPVVDPPAVDPPVDGLVELTSTDPWLLLVATLAAGTAMVSTTLALLRFTGSRGR